MANEASDSGEERLGHEEIGRLHKGSERVMRFDLMETIRRTIDCDKKRKKRMRTTRRCEENSIRKKMEETKAAA